MRDGGREWRVESSPSSGSCRTRCEALWPAKRARADEAGNNRTVFEKEPTIWFPRHSQRQHLASGAGSCCTLRVCTLSLSLPTDRWWDFNADMDSIQFPQVHEARAVYALRQVPECCTAQCC